MIENLGRKITDPTLCGTCRDSGQITHLLRPAKNTDVPGYEEMAPCPYCEKGAKVEFPPSGFGYWGTQGYWRGNIPDIPQIPVDQPLSLAENRDRLEQLMATTGLGKGFLEP